ncbi:hypothetical protein [Paeniroseomonas aquatica]|uniref:hypothetical protein n=1 Tax=Paeniroseomonas aquatica TaxID=373043 RepID=UPI0033907143
MADTGRPGLGVAADDDQLRGPRLPCQRIAGVFEEGAPFRSRAGNRPEPVASGLQHGADAPHVVLDDVRDHDAFAEGRHEGRAHRAGRQPDQLGAALSGKFGGQPDPRFGSGARPGLHHECLVGHRHPRLLAAVAGMAKA